MVNHVALFEQGGFSLLFSINASATLSQDQLLAAVYEQLPVESNEKVLELKNGQETLVLRDSLNEGPLWLSKLLVEDDEHIETPELVRTQPIFKLGSTPLRIVMLFAAIVFPKEARFYELRHLLRTLQYVYLYDWSKELNIAYLGSKKKNFSLRLKRGFVLGVINFITSMRKVTVVGVSCCIAYLLF